MIDSENEYCLELKIEALHLNEHYKQSDIQIIIIYGESIYKMFPSEENESNQLFITVHSTPSNISYKLLNTPMALYVTTKNEYNPIGMLLLISFSWNKKSFNAVKYILGAVSLNASQYFANAVKCRDFRSETLRRTTDLKCGSMEIYLIIAMDTASSHQNRIFYSNCSSKNTALKKLIN